MTANWNEGMGADEVAKELGIRKSNIDRQANMPAPKQDLAMGRLWKAAEIRAYARKREKARRASG